MICTARTATVLAVATVLVTTAGCGGSSGGDSKPQTVAKSQLAPAPTAPKANVDQVRMAIPAKVSTLDPLLALTITEVDIEHLLSGTLFNFAPDGKKIIPGLATKGDYSADRKAFTVTLNPDAAFSDGSPVTQKDVVATFDRARKIKVNNYGAQFTPITSVTPKGSDQVTFTFSRPYLSFKAFLAYPNMALLKASEIKSGSYKIPDSPTFAGRYAVQGDAKSGRFVLARNEHYPKSEQPAVAKLDVSVITDAQGRRDQLVGGQVDFVLGVSANQLKNLPKDILRNAAGTAIFSYMGMNNQHGLTKDVHIRKAISYALDRQQISKIAWGGFAKPIADFFTSTMSGFEQLPVTADLAKAKQELAGTKCAKGCTMSLMLDQGNDEWGRPTGVVVQQQLRKIGIKLNLQTLDSAAVVDRLGKLDYDLSIGYFGDYADLPEGLPAYCLSSVAGLQACLTGYKSKEADALVEKTASATDDAGVQDGYKQMNAIFARDQPFATLSDWLITAGLRKSLSGVIAAQPNAFVEIAPLDGGA